MHLLHRLRINHSLPEETTRLQSIRSVWSEDGADGGHLVDRSVERERGMKQRALLMTGPRRPLSTTAAADIIGRAVAPRPSYDLFIRTL